LNSDWCSEGVKTRGATSSAPPGSQSLCYLASQPARHVNPMLSGYHHWMARHQVADRGDILQVWIVAANVMNKQLRTADRG